MPLQVKVLTYLKAPPYQLVLITLRECLPPQSVNAESCKVPYMYVVGYDGVEAGVGSCNPFKL